MNPVTQAFSPRADNPTDRLARGFYWLTAGLAFLGFVVALATLLFDLRVPGKPGWVETMLVLTTAAATLASLARQLPGQNVILSAAVIGLIGGVAHGLGAATAIPFGPFIFTERAGPRLFNTLAWPMPFVWVIAILNSRGVARLILRPWRKFRAYGFWLIGLTIVLSVLFDAALEPFASNVERYWLWDSTLLPVTWHGSPLSNFLGWLVTSLLILAFVTPVLIDKRQRPVNRPPDYHPLVVWLLAMAFFAAGAAAHQLWTAVAYCVFTGLAVVVFAFRGARW